jgi:hypothetical protein
MGDPKEGRERRTAERYRVNLDADIEFVHPGFTNAPTDLKIEREADSGEIWFVSGVIETISRIGATVRAPGISQQQYFRLLHHPEIKTVRLRSKASKLRSRMRLNGRIIWSDYHSAPQGVCYFGVSFEALEDKDRRMLEDYLQKVTDVRRTRSSPIKR